MVSCGTPGEHFQLFIGQYHHIMKQAVVIKREQNFNPFNPSVWMKCGRKVSTECAAPDCSAGVYELW